VTAPVLTLTIFARDEERRIGRCLAGLPLGRNDVAVHVVVNGSTDRTAAIARTAASNLTVHEWPRGGKALSWNRFVHDVRTGPAIAPLFADGDAEIEAGSVDALVGALADHPGPTRPPPCRSTGGASTPIAASWWRPTGCSAISTRSPARSWPDCAPPPSNSPTIWSATTG